MSQRLAQVAYKIFGAAKLAVGPVSSILRRFKCRQEHGKEKTPRIKLPAFGYVGKNRSELTPAWRVVKLRYELEIYLDERAKQHLTGITKLFGGSGEYREGFFSQSWWRRMC